MKTNGHVLVVVGKLFQMEGSTGERRCLHSQEAKRPGGRPHES